MKPTYSWFVKIFGKEAITSPQGVASFDDIPIGGGDVEIIATNFYTATSPALIAYVAPAVAGNGGLPIQRTISATLKMVAKGSLTNSSVTVKGVVTLDRNLTNANFGVENAYVIYEDRVEDKQLSVNTIFNSEINNNITLNAKIEYKRLRSNSFANIIDLLGGDIQLRSKREFIEKFIDDNLPFIEDADKIEDEFGETSDWIELYNAGTKEVNLMGWSLIDEDITHESFTINDEYLIQPDEYVILTKERSEFEKFISIGNKIFGDFDFGFGGNDIVVLKDLEGITHDSVNYDNDEPWSTEADGTGFTIELKNPKLDNNVGINWEVSQNELGTPGEINSNYDTISSVILADNYKEEINIKQSNNIYKIETTKRIENIYLYDISGRELINKSINYNNFKLDLSEYSFGVYLLLIDYGDKTNTLKLIIN